MAAKAIYWLIEQRDAKPSLQSLADHLGLSEAHVQKTFQANVGLSPKQFLTLLTRDEAMERLRRGETVLDAALNSGLSGPGRLHDLLIRTEALTPGEARRRGEGVGLAFGFGNTPFGKAMLAWSERGISFLGFAPDGVKEPLIEQLSQQWPDATLTQNNSDADLRLESIFDDARTQPLRIWLRGSPFQLKVWEALLCIPPDHHVSYGYLAHGIGKDNASRAVGTAVGRNPVAWLIPCHRVITSSGALGGYRWGLRAKQLMIGMEATGTMPGSQVTPELR